MKVALISGLCRRHDAISTAVLQEREVLVAAGHEVKVFTQSTDCLAGDDVFVTSDPWLLQRDPFYVAANLVVFHFGIRYELFNALLVDHPHAAMVVRFHNVTPPELLEGAARWAAIEAFDQISIADRADVVWSDSPHNSDVLVEHCDIDPDRVRLLPLCVPMVEARPPPRVAHPDIRIQAVGRFVRAKGLHDLVEAYGALDAADRDGTELVLIGSLAQSDEHYVERLRTRIGVLGLTDRVQLLHDVSDAELHASFQTADVFVSPSLHEGFCIPVVEALANDCRVIATDAGALPDTVDGFGDVVTTGDIDAMRDAVAVALADVRSPGWAAGVEARRRDRAGHLINFGPTAFRRRLLMEVERAVNMRSPFASANPVRDAHRFGARHRLLIDRLACPLCRGVLEPRGAVLAHGSLANAELVCAEHGRQGVVSSFRPGFLARDLERFDGRDSGLVEDVLDLVRDTEAHGAWTLLREGMLSDGSDGARLVFDAEGPGFEVRFHGQGWSGRLEVRIDGELVDELDLYRSSPEPVTFDSGRLTDGTHEVEIRPVGAGHRSSRGSQVIVSRIVRRMVADAIRVPDLAACNRGNPYPERFAKLLLDVAADGAVLDCGGGDRRFGDDRVVNLEYLDYDLPDLYGDGLALPFADDSFDLVLSQAVLEHVPDPQRAVDELIRVLKPGGRLYAEAAFMQPLHAVPYHYMNITPHGIEHLCRDLEIEETGTFGGLEVTMTWLTDLLNARAKIGDADVDQVLATMAALDRATPPDEMAQLASAVYVVGTKRASSASR